MENIFYPYRLVHRFFMFLNERDFEKRQWFHSIADVEDLVIQRFSPTRSSLFSTFECPCCIKRENNLERFWYCGTETHPTILKKTFTPHLGTQFFNRIPPSDIGFRCMKIWVNASITLSFICRLQITNHKFAQNLSIGKT